MASDKVGFQQHLFICTNSPDKKGKCGHKGSEDLRKKLKEECREAFEKGTVRVNSSGCLGYCENGIAAVIYRTDPPVDVSSTEWFLDLDDKDSDVLLSALKKASSAVK